MQQSNEFRIGNLMQDRKGALCKVDELSPNSVKAHAVVGPITALPCSPIPLTEEWLVKFATEIYKGHVKIGNVKIYCNNYNNGEKIECIVIYKTAVIKLTNNYVHTLQNLYFALTGEELNPL